MGRVARYKKVKAFDPHSKSRGGKDVDLEAVGIWGLTSFGGDGRKAKKVSKTVLKLRARRGKNFASKAPVLDAPCEGGDDFDLSDLVGSLRREVPPSAAPLHSGGEASKTRATAAPQVQLSTATKQAAAEPTPRPSGERRGELVDHEDEEEKVLRRLKLDAPPQPPVKDPIVKAPGRMPGESQRAYQRRVKAETRQIMQRTRQEQHNPGKRLRKKEFLKRKKLAKKSHRAPSRSGLCQSVTDPEVDSDDEDVAARRETRLVFGEQVEAPPVFRQIPRGAALKTGPARPPSATRTGGAPMAASAVRAEQDNMERLRLQVQAQYAHIKARRKRDGDFHL